MHSFFLPELQLVTTNSRFLYELKHKARLSKNEYFLFSIPFRFYMEILHGFY